MNTNLHLQLLKPPHKTILLLYAPQNHFQIPQYTVYKRRRLKLAPKLSLFNHLAPPLSVDPIHLLAPALVFASGVALYLSQFKSAALSQWILFSSPTPFNRFVLHRCPSISFHGGDFSEDVSEKLVKEERHFVWVNRGRIRLETRDWGGSELEEKLEYQRVCVRAEDGGVLSLDWPANLELKEEHGLDTTLLLVPGTAEGSLDKNIRLFVCEALERGFFPVVVNPRGCAGSPLTTARLFTAADSDDISTALQFINKARPWTTLVGVGWGYGANMLTKYLAEVGERTPLTAATCIDNPFDLEEATQSSPHHFTLDQKLAGGLIGILRSNKELFQGKAKGFDVEKALSAKSVRAFEKAISMVSYGFDALEDFYSKASTRGVVENVKIPVLFIQSDDRTVPLFSVPRSSIAENPYTSLLLCSCLPSGVVASGTAAISWCQNLTIEWLSAVELGLLKGRHPLLEDVDVTVHPSKGFGLVEGITADKSGKIDNPFELSGLNALDDYSMEPMKEVLEDSDTVDGFHLRSSQEQQRNWEPEGLQEVENVALQKSSSVDQELDKEEEASPLDSERGQVLQAAQVAMNMLDVTAPGTLSEEEKKKVLTAVGQGETLMKALQDAVPEDVREKLTTAVSGILHAQGTNLKFDRLLNIDKILNLPSEFKSKVEEKTSADGLYKDPFSSDQVEKTDDSADGSDDLQSGIAKHTGALPPKLHSSEYMHKSVDLVESQPYKNNEDDDFSSLVKHTNESGINRENAEFSKEIGPNTDSSEKDIEMSAKPSLTSSAEKADGIGEVDMHNGNQDVGIARVEAQEESLQKDEEKIPDFSTDQNKMTSPNMAEEAVAPLGSSSEPQPMEREDNDNQRRESKSLQHVIDLNKSIDPSLYAFSVSQALDALARMDDSTQVAVNSVFGVIENMISQLEDKEDNESEVKDSNKVDDEEIDAVSQKQRSINNHALQKNEAKKEDPNVWSELVDDPPEYDFHDNIDSQHYARTGWAEEELTRKSFTFTDNDANVSQRNNTVNNVHEKKKGQLVDAHLKKMGQLVGRKLSAYGDFLHNEYFRTYLLVKMRNSKLLDLDETADLLLHYIPEEGQWMLLEPQGSNGNSIGDDANDKGVDRAVETHSLAKINYGDKIIEPSYVILDTEKQQQPIGEYSTLHNINDNVENTDDRSEELMQFVKMIISDALRVEVDRRLSASDLKKMEPNLATDIATVANALSLAVGYDEEHAWYLEGKADSTAEKVGTLHGKKIIRAISSAVQGTSYLRRVLPVGVIVGSSLAALRKYFNVSTVHDNGRREALALNQIKLSGDKTHVKDSKRGTALIVNVKNNQNDYLNGSMRREAAKLKNLNSDAVMVGAVTAALGASALLVQPQDSRKGKETGGGTPKLFKEEHHKEPLKHEEISERNQNKIVASLAEKAMSVAGPVVPTKEDGEVDQERLVAMLADLGQKGGMLKLIGKIALLWGGLRGAMSLTDRLISFLRIAERPLLQRILGFFGMLIVLWSPIVVPLLPTLVQSWATNNPSRIAELACVVGLYIAVMILVMMWGKRIRGYENPLEQYGLDMTSLPKVQNFLKALIGGVVLVLIIQFGNALLGCVSLSWPSSPPSSLDAMAWLKVYGGVLMLTVRGFINATVVALVEELLFRSWLPEEIAADLGYHRGIIIAGLAFSLFQGCPCAIPGLWLLSLALAGARQRSQGSLTIPTGFRAGIMASSFVLETGGVLTYKPTFPLWVTGNYPFQPFSGVVGLALSLLLAIILYPRESLQEKKLEINIR
ncbi:Abi domain-containing protein [Cephalotus follicularis]|uniref:Abi domain-containing protein n=1 Tax=Cephalotus follicularis TaxID=3775 RepID=A0A1Q3BSS1_CEPFO|nr:Abi domain-containing protein [Cephalotus follicularis]